MRRLRGFKLGGKLVRVFKWIIRPRTKPTRFHSLRHHPNRRSLNPVPKILALLGCLRRGAKALCFSDSDPGYIQLGGGKKRKQAEVPKGHLAVYVGKSDGDARRVVVPVIYFNHPLFGELLKEAERVHGYDHPGRITIPCEISEFEKVKTRIAAWDNCHRRRSHKTF